MVVTSLMTIEHVCSDRDSPCKFPLIRLLICKKLFKNTFFIKFVGITQTLTPDIKKKAVYEY